MKPYGLIADLHLHNWQSFSTAPKDGVNTRLAGLLGEVERCAKEVRSAGGDTIYIAGDVFHVRGSIAPSVLNPTMDTFKKITTSGMIVYIIPGNHDLEGKSVTRIGSSVTALEGAGCVILDKVSKFDDFLLLPWHEDNDALKASLESIPMTERGMRDVIMHAPIDGTLTGIPAHGISPDYLAALGYRRLFAGHYHHHKDFDKGVYSIGALSHHSWSDVGTKSGFLVVSEDGVRWMKSHLPEFIDITSEIEPEELPLLVQGNYVRAKVDSATMSEIEAVRAELVELGAVGTIIQTVKKPAVAREAGASASIKAGASLETSVAEFIRGKSLPDFEKVTLECMNILAEAGV